MYISKKKKTIIRLPVYAKVKGDREYRDSFCVDLTLLTLPKQYQISGIQTHKKS